VRLTATFAQEIEREKECNELSAGCQFLLASASERDAEQVSLQPESCPILVESNDKRVEV